MNSKLKVIALSSLILSFNLFAKPVIELYKSPTCGCCKGWAAIMQEKGYEINVHHSQDWSHVQQKFGMPAQLMSCHSAVIDGYLFEGHIPESDIARVLKERPKNITGIASPGMPRYSPGMTRPGEEYKDFNLVSFDESGHMKLYKKY